MNCLLKFSLTLLISLIIVSSTSTVSIQPQHCTLPDIQRTEGECMHIRDCRYQLNRFRFGSNVTHCVNSTINFVCCPKTETVSQKKCSEWREMLYVPESFSLPRSKEPVCAVGNRWMWRKKRWTYGGSGVGPFEYPHVAALGCGNDIAKLKILCGATLINEKFLITAAQCVTNGSRGGIPSHAMLGDIFLNPIGAEMNISPHRKVIKIKNIFVHPNYTPPLIYNDIALVLLSASVELSKYILPACVSTSLVTPVRDRSSVEACGWGMSNKTNNWLHMANLTTLRRADCNSRLNQQSEKMHSYPNGILRSQICTIMQEDPKYLCRANTGSGLFVREGQCVFHIVGVMSANSDLCAADSPPAIYTAVASYQDWIESIVWKH